MGGEQPLKPLCRAALALSLLLAGAGARAADDVTEWTQAADALGHGAANWRTMVIMHMAMHDALNAADPRYHRWALARTDEPHAPAQAAHAAMVAAAREVLITLHPADRDDIDGFYQDVLARLPKVEGTDSALALGRLVGAEVLASRFKDGFEDVHIFPSGTGPGQWRPAPPSGQTSFTTSIRPFLTGNRSDTDAVRPPALGSPAYVRAGEEVRNIGSDKSSMRTEDQTYAAYYWAYQTSQRGYMLLAVSLLDAHPMADLHTEARFMSQMSAAMADSAVLAWSEKERFSFWRPITALQHGGFGLAQVPGWTPLIETPPHPDHPSGHATDCYTGAGMLAAAFPGAGPIEYVAQSGLPPAEDASGGMGQHAQAGRLSPAPRRFASLPASAEECANSRIWAGAHFRTANEEGRRIAAGIVARARDAVRPLTK